MSDSKPFPLDKGCPLMMDDGRFVTDFSPNEQINDFYKGVFNATSESDYRQKLQDNGLEIMKGNMLYHQQNNLCECQGEPCKFVPPLNFWEESPMRRVN
uniref:Uncharacterized protein n=1 Tax=Megaviridae environmental sample TaxID=1737588 RepID=A0A5J6VGY2_9VIRU|nr:MAG: hypothetical protein [Megaviridae environmental sample]